MHHLSSYLIGGLLTALAVDSITGGIAMPRWSVAFDASTVTNVAVNRDRKGDRLTTSANATQPAYRSVRLAGQLDTLAAPDDHIRSILFNATPMTGAGRAAQSFGGSVAGRGTAGPSPTALRPDPVNGPVPAKPPRVPEACDPAFSPIAAPSLAHVIGRCLT